MANVAIVAENWELRGNWIENHATHIGKWIENHANNVMYHVYGSFVADRAAQNP